MQVNKTKSNCEVGFDVACIFTSISGNGKCYSSVSYSDAPAGKNVNYRDCSWAISDYQHKS